jgi:predicted ATP-grasp superfamily ATP-dependent carboligase
VRRIASLPELRAFTKRVWAAGATLLVQDDIPGGPERIYFVGGMYDERSRPHQLYIGQKLLQYPTYVGSTSAARLVWEPGVLEACNRFAEGAGLIGLVDIEFKYDSRDGKFKLIEVNPRNGLWHRISDDGSCNCTAYYHFYLSGNLHRVGAYQAHLNDRLWMYPSRYLCAAVETWGIVRGSRAFVRQLAKTRIRCGSSASDLRRTISNVRVVVGHVRRLSPRTLLFGKGSIS